MSSTTPPPLPPHAIARARLQARLDDATGHVAIVAGSGWGKTTGLAAWARRRPSAWVHLTAGSTGAGAVGAAVRDALAAVAGEGPATDGPAIGGTAADGLGDAPDDVAIEVLAVDLGKAAGRALPDGGVLVVDEADHLHPGSPGARLCDALIRQLPPGVQLVTASRTPPGLDLDALRARAALAEVGVDDLRLTADETAQLVRRLLPDAGDAIAPAVHRLTAGWPEATHLVALQLRQVPAARRVAELQARGRGRVAVDAYVRTEVLPQLDDDLLDVLHHAVIAHGLDEALCAELGSPPDALERLQARGLLLPDPDGRLGISPVVAASLRSRDVPTDDGDRCKAVVDAYGRLGDAATAMEVALESGDGGLIASALLQHASDLTVRLRHDLIVRAAAAVVPSSRTVALDAAIADAHIARGEWTDAIACLRRADRGSADLPTSLAWRLGHLLYLRWQIPEALEVFDRAGSRDAEDWQFGVLRAEESFVRWLTGQPDRALACAREALELGISTRNPYVVCAAHTALAALTGAAGDPIAADRHHGDALAIARAHGVVLMEVRLRSNRVSQLVDVGRLHEAVAEAREVVAIADRTSHRPGRLLVTTNLAEALRQTGELDDAEHHATAAVAIGREGGIGLTVYPQLVLADVHRDRGAIEQASALYVQVAELAREAGDHQALGMALAGAARVTPDVATALAHAEEAVAIATGTAVARARLARAWCRLRADDRAGALADAGEVLEAARRGGLPGAEAEAHELLSVTAGDPDARDAHLAAALGIHRRIGAALAATRVAHVAARVAGDEGAAAAAWAQRAAASVRERVLEVAGLDQATAGPRTSAPRGEPGVRVFTLGGFAVHRDGIPVSTADWGSRKPRELLQVLLSRRGQRVPRGVVAEALWPDEAADRVANRLSGAISVLRGVLDPDKACPPDHFVAADPAAVWLDHRHLEVDLVRFHDAVTAARAALAAGDDDAEAALEQAVAIYAGEFLADVPYDDWSTAAREEARAVHLEALRTLFGLAARRGDHDAAIRSALRLLAEDPYDEDAYRQLIGVCSAAGRHGEAQRHYRTYVGQMRRLDIPPMPFPGASGLRDLV